MAEDATLFICAKNCDECEEAGRCPMAGDFSRTPNRILRDINDHLNKRIQNLADKITPERIIEKVGMSLFNFIQAIELELEIEHKMSKEDIVEKIINFFPENFLELITNNSEADPIANKLQIVIYDMAEKIIMMINGECSADDCAKCWMRKYCKEAIQAK